MRHQQIAPFPQRKRHAIALAGTRRPPRIMGAVAFSLASATIALWLAYLPWVTTQVLIQLRVLPF
jgi:hypothetical protein